MHPYGPTQELQLGSMLACGSARNHGLTDGSVDVVVTTAVLCSVTIKPRRFRRSGVLKPGGRWCFWACAAGRTTSLRKVSIRQTLLACIADGCDPAVIRESIVEAGLVGPIRRL